MMIDWKLHSTNVPFRPERPLSIPLVSFKWTPENPLDRVLLLGLWLHKMPSSFSCIHLIQSNLVSEYLSPTQLLISLTRSTTRGVEELVL